MGNKQLLQSAGDGTAVPAGYVGEERIAYQSTAAVTTTTANTEIDITGASITLTAGVWDLEYAADAYAIRTSGTNSVAGRIRVTDLANTNESKLESFYVIQYGAAGSLETGFTAHKKKRITITSGSITYKLRLTCNRTNTEAACSTFIGDITGSLTGDDATTYIRAVRIA